MSFSSRSCHGWRRTYPCWSSPHSSTTTSATSFFASFFFAFALHIVKLPDLNYLLWNSKSSQYQGASSSSFPSTSSCAISYRGWLFGWTRDRSVPCLGGTGSIASILVTINSFDVDSQFLTPCNWMLSLLRTLGGDSQAFSVANSCEIAPIVHWDACND